MTLAHFDKEDDIMNNVGDVYTVKALKPWRTPKGLKKPMK